MVSRITTPKPMAMIYYRSFENFGMSFISEELLIWMLVKEYLQKPIFPLPNCNKRQYLCCHTVKAASVTTDITNYYKKTLSSVDYVSRK